MLPGSGLLYGFVVNCLRSVASSVSLITGEPYHNLNWINFANKH